MLVWDTAGSLTVHEWDAGRESKALVGHQGVVLAAVAVGDGAKCATISRDKSVILWDLDQGA